MEIKYWAKMELSRGIFSSLEKLSSRGVLRKRCSEDMHKICRRQPCRSVISIKRNQTSIWVFPCRYTTSFQLRYDVVRRCIGVETTSCVYRDLLQICCIFSEHLFIRTSMKDCLWPCQTTLLWGWFSNKCSNTLFNSVTWMYNCHLIIIIIIIIIMMINIKRSTCWLLFRCSE